MAAEHILHMQKSLSLMNVQVHHVLSDITGLSGLAILDAILTGTRLCETRAALPSFCEEPPRRLHKHCRVIIGLNIYLFCSNRWLDIGITRNESQSSIERFSSL